MKLQKAYSSIQSGDFVRASNLAELISHFTDKCHGTWKAKARLEERINADLDKRDWIFERVNGTLGYSYRPAPTAKKVKKLNPRGHQRVMRSAPPALAA